MGAFFGPQTFDPGEPEPVTRVHLTNAPVASWAGRGRVRTDRRVASIEQRRSA